jgi:plasmid replication initiation protein
MDCVKTYPLIADLKKRVLNPALNEINAKTGVEILCKDRKRGRKIIGFEFVTRIRKQKDLFKD